MKPGGPRAGFLAGDLAAVVVESDERLQEHEHHHDGIKDSVGVVVELFGPPSA